MFYALPGRMTYITLGITDADTVIVVADASQFPEAPNLATLIDYDTGEFETVRYTSIDGNNLVLGTVANRGLEPETGPSAWPNGTKIGRLFTAFEYNSLLDTIGGIDEALTTAQSNISTLSTTLGNLVTDVDDLDTALGLVDGRLISAESLLSETAILLDQAVIDIGDLQTAVGPIPGIQQDIVDIYDSIQGLGDSIQELAELISIGIAWQEQVISYQNDPPVDPSEGDRYLVGPDPTSWWATETDNFATFDGSLWQFETPQLGYAVHSYQDSAAYVLTQTGWMKIFSFPDDEVIDARYSPVTDVHHNLLSERLTADEQRLDNLILESDIDPNKDAEIVDARYSSVKLITFDLLTDRITAIENDTASAASRLDILEDDDETAGSVDKKIKDQAEDATYDNTDSDLVAETIKTALDELDTDVADLETAKETMQGTGWDGENLTDHETRLSGLDTLTYEGVTYRASKTIENGHLVTIYTEV